MAQITVRSASGVILRAEERSGDMRQSIDASLDKMVRQIRRFKGKRWESRRSDGGPEEEAPAVELEEEEAEEARIVRIKRFETRPMDAEEAIEQMELLGHDFFVYAWPPRAIASCTSATMAAMVIAARSDLI